MELYVGFPTCRQSQKDLTVLFRLCLLFHHELLPTFCNTIKMHKMLRSLFRKYEKSLDIHHGPLPLVRLAPPA